MMLKLRNIIALMIFILLAIQAQAQQPQQILGIAKEVKPIEYYQEQSQLWQKELDKNPKDKNAWLQYYRAKRSLFQKSDLEAWNKNVDVVFDKLKPIIAQAKKELGNCYEYYILESYNTRDDIRYDYLQKAYALDPDRQETYETLLIHHMSRFDLDKVTDISKKMLEKNYYSNANLMWNYNALQTAKENGVFIANGDMDALPRWVLQYGQGIRKDVLVLSKWNLNNHLEYRKTAFAQLGIKAFPKKVEDYADESAYVEELLVYVLKNSTRPTYVSCGTDVNIFKRQGINDNMYLVGTAIVYSKTGFDNYAEIVDNFEEKYKLEYLLNNFQSHPEDGMVKMHMNKTYLPGLIKVKKYFEKQGNTKKADYYMSLIMRIAEQSGNKENILSWL